MAKPVLLVVDDDQKALELIVQEVTIQHAPRSYPF
jgi:hypothetical protein